MNLYRDLGRNPGVFRILGSQLLARFPFGMLSIVMLLHIQLRFGDYTSAGIVLASSSIGQAISGPLSSRLMGRFGMRRVLSTTSVLCALVMLLIAFAPLTLAVIVVLAFFMGLSTPPVTPAVRTLFPKLVPGNQLSALYSLDAAAQEIIWIFGPVVAVFASSQFGPAVGLAVAAGFLLIGGAWFIASPALGAVKIPPAKRGFGAVLRHPSVVTSTLIGFFFVASFAAVEVGIIGAFEGEGSGGGHGSMNSGIVLAVFAAGSLLGGLLLGHAPIRPWSLLIRMGLVLIGTLLCLVHLNVWWLSIMLFIGGIGTAPTFAALSAMIAATVPLSETAESFGWSTTGHLVGTAAGSAIAGIIVDDFGARGAILVSAVCLAVAIGCAAATMRWIPDLKGRAIEVPPETGPVTIPLA